tara:strand:- start:1768 stop:3000 length:1233 start_codon:yes stop_codon:yes gene_type:complete
MNNHVYLFYLLLLVYGCDEPVSSPDVKTPVYYFSRVFGENDAEMGYSIRSTKDNGFIIAGATSSYWSTDSLPRISGALHGVTDAIIAKVDSLGNTEWVKTYGGDFFESAFNAAENEQGGYFFTGYTNSIGKGLYDFWLVNLDEGGNVNWEKTYGTPQANVGLYGNQTADGGYAIAGYSIPVDRNDKDFWLLKTNSNGDSLWSALYGDSLNQLVNNFQETSDGGFILAGETWGVTTNNDILIIKTNSEGEQEWSKKIIEERNDQAYAIKETNNGYILIGSTTSLGAGNKDIWLIKLDVSGNVVWHKTYGGEALEYGFDVIPLNDGYVFTGSTSSYGTEFYDIWIIKVDLEGGVIWESIYGGPMIDIGRSIINNGYDGFTILGQTSSYGSGEYDFWMIKTNELGLVPESESF